MMNSFDKHRRYLSVVISMALILSATNIPVTASSIATSDTINTFVAETDENDVITIEDKAVVAASIDINDCIIEYQEVWDYTGNAIKPTIILKDSNNNKLSTSYYAVTYSNNISVGTAQATIVGKGIVSGRKIINFTIENNISNIENFNVTTIHPQTLTMVWQENPTKVSGYELTITSKENPEDTQKVTTTKLEYIFKNLKEKTDYKVTVRAYIKGSDKITNYGPYSNFDITTPSANINDCVITYQDTYSYTGSSISPVIEVKNSKGQLLKKDTDYTVSYNNNISVGTGNIVVKGKGKYSDTITNTFNISNDIPVVENLNNTLLHPQTLTMKWQATPTKVSGYELTITSKENPEDTQKVTTTKLEYIFKNLKEKTDYKVTVRAYIKGSDKITNYGPYSNFDITTPSANINDCVITYQDTYSYTGSSISPVIEVKNSKGQLLKKDTDYTVSYNNNISVGTGNIVVKGKGKYNNTINKTFAIIKMGISEKDITLSPTAYTYDGKEKKPTVTIKVGSRTLKSNTDYKVLSYTNNLNAGKGSVLIEGLGNYENTVKKEFDIAQLNISKTKIVLDQTSFIYNGDEIKPTVTMTYASNTLVQDVDYTLEYIDNVNVGNGKVVITGIGNYTGTITKSFSIKVRDIKQTDISLDNTTFQFNGSEIKPSVTVKCDSNILKQDIDYTLEYIDNVNAGEAKVVIKGIENCTGTITKSFSIKAIDIKQTDISLDNTTFQYNGSEIKPNVTIKYESYVLKQDIDYTLEYIDNVNAGEAKVVIKGIENCTGTITKSFSIKAIDIKQTDISLDNTTFQYNGSEIKPNVTIKYESYVLKQDIDYNLEYINNIKIGEAQVVIKGKNNFTGKVTKTFTINEISFDWAKDNWNFDNSSYYFSNYNVNNKVMKGMRDQFGLSDSDIYQIKQNIEDDNRSGFGGSCYGMTISEILCKQGDLDLTVFGGKKIVNQNSNTSDMTSVINFIQESQGISHILQSYRESAFHSSNFTQKQYIQKLEEVLSKKEIFVKVSYSIAKYTKSTNSYSYGYHAVLAHDINNCN
ncbi:MAG: fibronectin type III domain-containing protein [Ruminococcus sp.]|nr:fibronectin type III domain-containing protein [Ruminococcus sp.]